MCVCIRFPHKTFIYSNDLEEVARVPGRLALETGDRLSFLPSFLPFRFALPGPLGVYLAPGIPRWWLSSFDPVPCPRGNETASHDRTWATRRDTIYRVSIIAIPHWYTLLSLSLFFFPPPLSSSGRKRRREDGTGETESEVEIESGRNGRPRGRGEFLPTLLCARREINRELKDASIVIVKYARERFTNSMILGYFFRRIKIL